MKQKFKNALLIALVLLLAIFGGYAYIWKGGGRDLKSESPDFSVSSERLTSEFNANANNATKKYLNRAIEVRGTITAKGKDEIVLNSNIICIMQENTAYRIGKSVKIKGRILGFDDLMGEIKLDQCSITK